MSGSSLLPRRHRRARKARRKVVAGVLAALLVVAAVAVVGVAAFADQLPDEISLDSEPVAAAATPEGSGDAPTYTLASPVPTTSTTTTAPPEPEPLILRRGAEGPEVALLEQRLANLKYDVQTIDGHYGEDTYHAVMAFQKVYGLSRDGHAGPETMTALAIVAGDPPPMVPNGAPDRVEVDVSRQVVFLYLGGTLQKIISASTGNREVFCEGGSCRRALTPAGTFSVYARVSGWDEGPLGDLYNPLYFNGGIAIHGAESVPGTPASHGCVRVPMPSAEWLPSVIPNGMQVYVLEGDSGPVAFDAAGPDGQAPEANPEPVPDPAPPAPPPTDPPPAA